MKRIFSLLACIVSFSIFAQFEAEEKINLTEKQNDDVYLAGESINIDAKVNGDLVAAGNTIKINDSISQDLIVAGGTIKVNGYVTDDIRAAGGKLIIDTSVGDDIIIFGGEVLITKNTTVYGNLIAFSGNIEVNGNVEGMIKAYGGNLEINGKVSKDAQLYAEYLEINGEITGNTKMVAENINIGNNAKFFNDVEYWSESGEIDFKNSLVNVTANFNENLAKEQNEFPMKFLGVAAFSVWIFYVLSAFLMILILNTLLKSFLPKAAGYLDKEIVKSLGYGILYLLGVPVLILFTFIIIIGIPLGLFLIPIYIFSLLMGHLIIALLIAHHLNIKKGSSWRFWKISFIALAIAMALRLITLIPFLGFIISVVIIAIAYGLIGHTIFRSKKSIDIVE